MITEYGIHREHDLAIAGNELRRAIRDLEQDPATVDHVGLGTVRHLANVLACALDRQWEATHVVIKEVDG